MYFDLKVESIWSAGMLRALEVAVDWTSSGPTVRISMVNEVLKLRRIGREKLKDEADFTREYKKREATQRWREIVVACQGSLTFR